mgnify:CR=1 FL=1
MYPTQNSPHLFIIIKQIQYKKMLIGLLSEYFMPIKSARVFNYKSGIYLFLLKTFDELHHSMQFTPVYSNFWCFFSSINRYQLSHGCGFFLLILIRTVALIVSVRLKLLLWYDDLRIKYEENLIEK